MFESPCSGASFWPTDRLGNLYQAVVSFFGKSIEHRVTHQYREQGLMGKNWRARRRAGMTRVAYHPSRYLFPVPPALLLLSSCLLVERFYSSLSPLCLCGSDRHADIFHLRRIFVSKFSVCFDVLPRCLACPHISSENYQNQSRMSISSCHLVSCIWSKLFPRPCPPPFASSIPVLPPWPHGIHRPSHDGVWLHHINSRPLRPTMLSTPSPTDISSTTLLIIPSHASWYDSNC